MYRIYIGSREQLSLSEVKGLAKMKVLLVIFALALPLFAEPAEALCTSTQGDPCLSKAEVSKIFIALPLASCHAHRPLVHFQATEKRYGRYYTDESPCFDYRGKGVTIFIIPLASL